MPMTDSLDIEIRSLYAELVDAVPPPPLLNEEDLWIVAKRQDHRPSRVVAISGAVGIAGVIAILLGIFIPSGSGFVPNAAASDLREISASAALQPPLTLGPNQWLQATQQLSATVAIYPDSTNRYATTNAQATIAATIEEWGNSTGTSCVSLVSSSVEFATSVNMKAWIANGFLTSPRPDPEGHGSCISFTGGTTSNGLGAGVGAISVATLPTDPQALAQELANGTTGIQGLDQLDSGSQGGLDRATILLSGPTIGATPAFNAALFKALALVPGIHPLGEVATHSGKTGLGFAAESALGTMSIIVDPSTGALLEARNVVSQEVSAALNDAYEASFSGGYGQQTVIQWLDPVGVPTVVNANVLPPGAQRSLRSS